MTYPTNEAALEEAAKELFFTITAHKSAADVLGFDWKKLPAATRAPWETASSKVVAAYLSALPKPPEGWEAQAKNFMRVIDRLSAENEALKAAALPEVTSVEELRSVPVGTAFFDADADWVYQIQSNGEPGAAGRIIVSAGIEEEFTPEELKYPLQILPPARRNYDLPD